MSQLFKITDFVIYNVSLKLADYQTLPLVIAWLHHPSKESASNFANTIRRPWARTKSMTQLQHQRAVALFADDAAAAEFNKMADESADTEQCEALSGHSVALAIARVNELSVERLHHVGAQKSSRSTHHGPVPESFALRGPEIDTIMDTPEALGEFADIANKLTDSSNVVGGFQFSNHVVLKLEHDLRVAKGGFPFAARAFTWKALRSVLYRSDIPTMFERDEAHQI